jgi:hypothetical protein
MHCGAEVTESSTNKQHHLKSRDPSLCQMCIRPHAISQMTSSIGIDVVVVDAEVRHLCADLERASISTRTLQQAHSEIAKAMQLGCADLQSTKEVLAVVKKDLESESKQILRMQTKTRGNPDRGTRVPGVHSTLSSRPARSLCS